MEQVLASTEFGDDPDRYAEIIAGRTNRHVADHQGSGTEWVVLKRYRRLMTRCCCRPNLELSRQGSAVIAGPQLGSLKSLLGHLGLLRTRVPDL